MTVLTGGLSIAHDTGQVDGSKDFTTLVILHGYVWHSGQYAPFNEAEDDRRSSLSYQEASRS